VIKGAHSTQDELNLPISIAFLNDLIQLSKE